MKVYTGNFKSVSTYGDPLTYNVRIEIPSQTNETITITDPKEATDLDEPLVMFGENPVFIDVDRGDLTKHIVVGQATINLVTNINLTQDLFASNNQLIEVTITQLADDPDEDLIIFYGYVDPLQFEEPMAHKWSEIEITATDQLGRLSVLSVRDVYNSIPGYVTFYDFLTRVLYLLGITYIGWVEIPEFVSDAIHNAKFNMSRFWGDSEDNASMCSDIYEEICKYLNLYVYMGSENVYFHTTVNQNLSETNISHFDEIAADESTSISVDDVYSQINITCDIEPPPSPLISFTNKDQLKSIFQHQEKYMSEIVSVGEGERAFKTFYQLVHLYWFYDHVDPSDSRYDTWLDSIMSLITWDKSYTVDHFCYVLENRAYDFGTNGYTNQTFYDSNEDQRQVLAWLASNRFKGALIGYGKGNKIEKSVTDNSPQSTIKLENWLVISTNGRLDDSTQKAQEIATQLEALKNDPICKYTGIETTAALSPTSPEVTNYLIITGSILLNPLQYKTGWSWSTPLEKIDHTWNDVARLYNDSLSFNPAPYYREYYKHTVPHPDNEDGAYYAQKWYWGDPSVVDETAHDKYPNGIYGYLDNSTNQDLKYEYNSSRDATDKISKLPIIACKLKIHNSDSNVPDKYCVERLDRGEDGVGVYEWLTDSDIATINANLPQDNQLGPYFTIGIDPKIGDYIIGQTFSIQNNIDYTMGLDTSGTAIPIRYDDYLAGTVEFEIIGPYNLIYEETTHSTHNKFLFWKCEHWDINSINVLEHIQNIMIKDLKIEVKSDNGLVSSLALEEDNDLVYASDENPDYIEKLEVDLKICSGLTAQECADFHIKNETSQSYVLNTDNSYFRGFYDSSDFDYVKPEHCMLDYLYKEYNLPAKILDTKIHTNRYFSLEYGNAFTYEMMEYCYKGIYPYNGIYVMPGTGYYMIMKYSTNLKMQTSEISIREAKARDNIQINLA